MQSPKTPGDVYSLDARTLRVERWTFSETGGLNAEVEHWPILHLVLAGRETMAGRRVFRLQASGFSSKYRKSENHSQGYL